MPASKGESMEREEPRIGAPDLSEIDFRRGEHRVTPATRPKNDLWWQIALGVFIGLMAHSAVVGLYLRWEMAQTMKQFTATLDAETKKMERQAEAAARAAMHPKDNRPWPTSMRVPPPPLRDGERCIKGERFKRLENGWQHLPRQPCE